MSYWIKLYKLVMASTMKMDYELGYNSLWSCIFGIYMDCSKRNLFFFELVQVRGKEVLPFFNTSWVFPRTKQLGMHNIVPNSM